MSRNGVRIPYQEAARELLRTAVLDAMRELLFDRDWSKITLSDVATAAGVSRQTLYNEFGSRGGLAQAYALRLATDLVDHVDSAIAAHTGDAAAALEEGLAAFFRDAAVDPLVRSLVTGEAKPDLLRLITLDAEPLIDHATDRLSRVFQHSWVAASPDEADVLAHTLVRLALSYIPTPPAPGRDAPAELRRVFTPFVTTILAARELR
ncbi:TetR/AcrR family transcriptional regulator [Nocardia paucivorans]|uniref:TetR/AcrR family transcriptional regulator n=1 Tax=Nocardia paucivorans TaxID=114259 RepID=UPI000593C758|nr:TetR/AcrR family transcriptional regulator [Nocardia paucivorans]